MTRPLTPARAAARRRSRIANELRRDTNQLRPNDHIGVMFDTFYDRLRFF